MIDRKKKLRSEHKKTGEWYDDHIKALDNQRQGDYFDDYSELDSTMVDFFPVSFDDYYGDGPSTVGMKPS